MTEAIPFFRPDIGDDEIEAVVETLRSGWITTGPSAKAFEREFADAVGANTAVAVNSCTAAMHIALEAVGVEAGDEVVMPTLTFAATGEVVRYLGAKPVLIDIAPSDHNLDTALLERAVSSKTRAIMPVHFGGQACDMEAVMDLAKARDLFVIEDAAHAFPTRCGDKMVGAVGDITCFSFYATKTLTTGEGGMATTDNTEWADRMRVMSLHGISKDAWKRYTGEGSWYYEIIAPGFKYNMTDIAAAMGLVQLRRSADLLARRRQLARMFTEALSANDALELLEVRAFDDHSWHLFLIKLVRGALRIDRAQFIDELKQRGIGCSVHFIPLHVHPYYRETYGYAPEDFPVAWDCYQRTVSLPFFSRMTDAEATRVVEVVTDVTKQFRR